MASGVTVQLFCLTQLLYVVAMPWLRGSFCFLVILAGSPVANLVCGVTQERFRSLKNNQLIAVAKVEEAELKSQKMKCATAWLIDILQLEVIWLEQDR